ncbi:copper homeostasis periplasmic binding protein CopC [Brenneria rubrifaciens]
MVFSPALWAHAHLKSQTPVADSTVDAAPATLTLTFSENIEPAFSGVEIVDGARQSQAISKTSVARNQMNVTLANPLASGRYLVNWRVLSVDGHKLKGSYRFTVK